MNPDSDRNVMDQMPYSNGIKTNEITTYLDNLSHKKQLPLHQQTSKPFHRYKTTATNTIYFNQGDALPSKPDLSGFSRNPNNGLYYTGSVNIISEAKAHPVPTSLQQMRMNQAVPNQDMFTLDQFTRPFSASEVTAGIHNNGIKHTTSSLAVSSLPEMSSTPPRPPVLQKNPFLRPLSETPNIEIGQVSSSMRSSSTLFKQEPCDSFLLHRHNNVGPVLPLKSFSKNQGVITNAAPLNMTFFPKTMDSLISKSSLASHSTSNNENRSNSQESSKPDENTYYTSANSNIESKASATKLADTQNGISSHSNGVFPAISNEQNISTASNIVKTTDPDQPVSKTSAASMVDASENTSLKKMPVTNTLTGLAHYRRFSEPRTSSILVSGNKNSSNIGWQYPYEHTAGSVVSASLLRGQAAALPSFNPSFDKSSVSIQSRLKPPSTRETKIDMAPQTGQDNVPMSKKIIQIKKLAKPPLDLKNMMGATQTPVNIFPKSNQIVRKSSKFLLENHSQGAGEKKVSKSRSKVSSTYEQRTIGDGAASVAKKLSEISQPNFDIVTSTPKTEYNDEESDDCDETNDDTFSGSLEESGDEEEHINNDYFSNGERQPGDGEANGEITDENDELESLDGNTGDDASDSCLTPVSEFEKYQRPMTAGSTHVLGKENARQDSCLKSPLRPVTALGSAVIKPALRYSLFHKIPPTINFVSDGEKTEQLPLEMSRLMKWKMSPITPVVVRTALARAGFKITKRSHDWLGCFGKHMKSICFKSLHDYQKLNHFPGSFQIGRKDKLWRSLSKMQLHFGKQEFNFFPQTFVLPGDMKLLKQTWEDSNTKQKWIIKPPASARGIGIRVISKWSQIPKRRPVIVQKYIHRPFLINSSKFDMRIYVYVSCYDPLRLYVYEDGLARFASCRYSSSTKTLNNRFMHLTNYSVNKNNSDYLNNTDTTVCQGHKWSLKALWNFMKKQGINTNLIWETIRDLIIKTIISGEPVINSMTKSNTCSRYCCHELFGFDILLDENFKPWILEVNISPSLHSNSQLDISIKGAMIKDMLNMAGFRLPDEREIASSRTGIDSGATSPLNAFCMDKRLFTTQLSPDERAKHAFYCQRYMDELNNLTILGDATKALWACAVLKTAYLKKHMQAVSTILNILTPDDLRLLCESIDEDSRKGNFQRLFPTPSTHRYLRYFEQPRYYNLLLDQWVLHYNHKEPQGIKLLQTLCAKEIHLQNPTTDPHHQWILPKPSYPISKSCDARIHSHRNSARGSGHQLHLLRSQQKLPLKLSQLSQSSSNNSLNSLTHSPKHLNLLNSRPSSSHHMKTEGH